MKRKTDSRIHRRDISLHPDIMQGFSLFRDKADVKDLEFEFCDTLQRVTRISYFDNKAVLQVDTSSVEAVCLVHFALRDDYLNELIEYLAYLIWAEQAFIYGKYSIAKHFSKKFDSVYSDLYEHVTNNLKSTDGQFVLLALYFIFVHEVTHYKYISDQKYKTIADNLRKMMRSEAEKHITPNGVGKDVALELLNDHIIGEELLCDSTATISMTSFSKALNMEVNSLMITEIIEAQAIIIYIIAVSKIIVLGGQIDKEEQMIFFQTLLRSLYIRVYSDKNRYLQTGGSNHIISPNGGFIWYVKPDNRGVKRHGIIPT